MSEPVFEAQVIDRDVTDGYWIQAVDVDGDGEVVLLARLHGPARDDIRQIRIARHRPAQFHAVARLGRDGTRPDDEPVGFGVAAGDAVCERTRPPGRG